MKLYTPSNTLLLDIEVDDTSVRYRSIMQDNNLTLNFSTVEPVVVPVGSYCTFEGQRYTLYYPENFKKVNSRNFEYTLVLHSHQEVLKLYKFKDLSAKTYRLKFPLTAKPFDFIKLLVDNLNKEDSGWSVGSYIDADDKLISFNHEYCYDVLNRIASEFNTEWEIENKTIHLRKIEKFKDTPLPLSYGKGNGFKSGVARQNDGDKQPIGKLYVQGGDRNIDYSTYGSSTLLLPKNATLEYQGKTYKTDADGMYITRVGNNNVAEDSYDASSVYPKRVGTVSSVIVADAEKNFYDIIDTSIPENLNYRDCRIAGEKATIVFQSGALAGREFDILQTETDLTGYDHAERKFEIVPAELDGMIMPGGVFVPKAGDKYAIFNISMPQAYISDNATKSGASWDMFKEAVKYFSEHEDARFIFRGELDGIWSKDKWLQIGGKITLGGHVLFSDNQFLPDGEIIRIVSIKDYVNTPFKPEITLSNAPVSGSFGSTLGKLEAEEVVIEKNRKEGIQYTKRQWRDTKETMSMLQESLLNFSSGINPITIQTMQLIAGDESLQFRFVNSKTAPVQVAHAVTFNKTNKQLTANAGIIQHMTLGIDKISPTHKPSDYKFWDMAKYISPPLNEAKPYYLYAKCSKTSQAGTFLLSTTAIELNSVSGFYHLLMGIINSEVEGDRSIGMLYGFSEITPARITTPVLSSPDGEMYIDLLSKVIKGNIKFVSGGKENDLGDWSNSITGDITEAQRKALDAERKAQQAIQDAENAVSDYNAKFALQQQQIDGQISSWFYPYSPTLNNIPASLWTTNEEKDRHIGDTFTNTQNIPLIDAGKSWRFVKNGSTYEWSQISDSDALLALQKASEAQSTADGKSTTYLVQPSNYDVGDMWVLGEARAVNGVSYKQGDLLTSLIGRDVFRESDWGKRVRYTDDSAVDGLEIGDTNLVDNSNYKDGLNYTFTPIPSNPNSILIDGVAKYTHVGRDGSSVRRLQLAVKGLDKGIHTFAIRLKAEVSDITFSTWDGANILSGADRVQVGSDFSMRIIQFEKTTDKNSDLIIRIYQHRESATSTEPQGITWIDWYKLVRGNKITEGWSASDNDIKRSQDAVAEAKANLARIQAEAHADGRVDAEEARAIQDAQDKLNEAVFYAKELVDNLEIDTVNLLRGSDFTKTPNDAYSWVYSSSALLLRYSNGFSIYRALVNSSALRLQRAIILKKGVHVISISAKAKYGFDFYNFVNANILSKYSQSVDEMTTHWAVFEVLTDGEVIIRPYLGSRYQIDDEIFVENIMINKGSRLMTWQQNPKDTQELIAQAQADANEVIAKTKGFTKIGGIEFDSGLIFSSIIKLFDVLSGNETAGISGILGTLRNNPSFWSGGTYAQAMALVGFLAKVATGTTPSVGEYNSLAKITTLHNGAAKIGDFIIEESGRILMIDPDTGAVRLAFTTSSLPKLEDLIGNIDSGSVTVGNGFTSSTQNLTGTANVKLPNGKANIGTIRLSAGGTGRKLGGVNSMVSTTLELYRDNTKVADIGQVYCVFTGDDWQEKSESIYIDPSIINLPGKGEYRFVLSVERSGSFQDHYGSSQSFNFAWNSTPQGINQQQYSPDGMMSYFSNFHLYVSQLTGLDIRGKTNMPGVLASGTVNSNGGQTDVWGAKSSMTGTTAITGGRRVPLSDLKHSSYTVMITPHTNTTFRVGSKTQTGFEALGSGAFDYIVVGKNYP